MASARPVISSTAVLDHPAAAASAGSARSSATSRAIRRTGRRATLDNDAGNIRYSLTVANPPMPTKGLDYDPVAQRRANEPFALVSRVGAADRSTTGRAAIPEVTAVRAECRRR